MTSYRAFIRRSRSVVCVPLLLAAYALAAWPAAAWAHNAGLRR